MYNTIIGALLLLLLLLLRILLLLLLLLLFLFSFVETPRKFIITSNRDYFMVGECVRFLFTSCASQRVNNKNRTNEPTMK